MKIFGSLVICLGVAAIGCGKKSKGTSAPIGPVGFGLKNNADEGAFKAKSQEFLGMVDSGQRLNLADGDDSGKKLFSPGKMFQLGVLDSLLPPPSNAGTDSCTLFDEGEEPSLSLVGGADEGQDQDFSLYEGQTCGNAMKQVKSFYANFLKSLRGQVKVLGKLEPSDNHCGAKIEKLPVDTSRDALGFRITAAQPQPGERLAVELRGGANDEEVALTMSLDLAGKMQMGIEENSMDTQTAIQGFLSALGNLKQHSLATQAKFAINLSGTVNQQPFAVNTNMSADSNVSGLAEGELLNVDESVTMIVAGTDEGGKAVSQNAKFKISLRELSESEFAITGSIEQDGQEAQKFEMVVKSSADSCEVGKVGDIEDYEPTPDQDSATPPDTADPIVTPPDTVDPITPPDTAPFDPTSMSGTWEGNCNSLNPHYEYAGNWREFVKFGNNGSFQRTLEIYDDENCSAANMVLVVAQFGRFTIGKVDDVDQHLQEIDLELVTVSVMPLTEKVAGQLHLNADCEGTQNWSARNLYRFPAGECRISSLPGRLLNGESMRYEREYSLFKFGGDSVLIMPVDSLFNPPPRPTYDSRKAVSLIKKD